MSRSKIGPNTVQLPLTKGKSHRLLRYIAIPAVQSALRKGVHKQGHLIREQLLAGQYSMHKPSSQMTLLNKARIGAEMKGNVVTDDTSDRHLPNTNEPRTSPRCTGVLRSRAIRTGIPPVSYGQEGCIRIKVSGSKESSTITVEGKFRYIVSVNLLDYRHAGMQASCICFIFAASDVTVRAHLWKPIVLAQSHVQEIHFY
ncbi:hypothetical protein HPP92_009368 [Vanilla planifolia]|uniref:Uncharacterized protein n=1 Tax=Vanilla planifolia TaxID=51239 RepID=A0A835V2S9_VANPL|nr:hypothetical protein HPP92_009368 [Vanilla planifolia]